MRLLTGPAGSGKTSLILTECRAALRSGQASTRLLVPTATMARHLQNQFAREGFVLRRESIQTLHQFIEPWVADTPQVAATTLYLMVEQSARRVNRAEFARVAELPGFCAALARTIQEFASAGCDSAHLAKNLPDAPLSEAFLAIYRDVENELASRGLAMRGKRLQMAAELIALGGTPDVTTVWLDGFHALPEPELNVIAALGRHAEVTLSINDSDATDRLRTRLEAMGFRVEPMPRSRVRPAVALFTARNVEGEANEIARRILEQTSAGRPFREMGVIVRAAETYVPILRSTFERFGIPARFYFDSNLDEHAVARFLSTVLEALLSGWDHARTLAAMRLGPHLADLNHMDRFDFEVRELLPDRGLEPLRAIAQDSAPLQKTLDNFASLETWLPLQLSPKDWAARFCGLRVLFRRGRVDATTDREVSHLYRTQSAALNAFDEAVEEAAQALPQALPLNLEAFWRTLKSALRLKPLRPVDGRRDVVQVMSAPEARQWVLPVVFVCGMVEKQFPQLHRQDAFFPDGARQRLNASGIRVRTAADFEREELSLFDAAISRATLLVALSYPETDARGETNLASVFLEDFTLDRENARAVQPPQRRERTPRPAVEIQSAALRDALRAKTAKLSPSGLESYLQCAFQYFGGRTLRLKKPPYRPEERLDYMLQGTVVHEVLAQWYSQPQPAAIEDLFEAAFAGECDGKRIPNNYHTERLRNSLLDDLRVFLADPRALPHGQRFETETKFTFALDPTAEISGRIDRIDIEPDGSANIFDYKYSAAANMKGRLDNENLLQGPLYAMAAQETLGINVSGVFYIGLKGGLKYAGWSKTPAKDVRPFPERWLENARARTLEAMEQIRAGRVHPLPSNPANCRFCDYRDICRVTTARGVALTEEMTESA